MINLITSAKETRTPVTEIRSLQPLLSIFAPSNLPSREYFPFLRLDRLIHVNEVLLTLPGPLPLPPAFPASPTSKHRPRIYISSLIMTPRILVAVSLS